ncbi:DUF2182 domain-containing protein [Nitrogeniibacter mangrovi]|uniref:DUF2182 domain-containing protein n=2 Tax=Nitrogeniibacter mangrovi TaxID=2016596 RepID=A0A6C1BAW2_9RHOO|nr:DUF2182 domain-containing protein [Nitrogeniibacter mangrovi]
MDVSGRWVLMPRMTGWTALDLVLVFLMWALMMAGMMLPTVVPVFRLLRRIDRADAARACPWCRSAGFALGYLSVWAGFSLGATLLQWGLLEMRLVSPMMESASTGLSGVLLVLAGIYQFSPLKNACLQRCRSPLSFLMTQRSDSGFRLGLRQGSYCAGCCALLMLLLFVLGVMNLWWIVALTVFVILEKTVPDARWFSRLSGVGLMAWGAWMLVSGVGV